MKIINITGGSGSGKTTFANLLNNHLINSFILSQDLYFKDVSNLSQIEKMDYDFDNPNSVHLIEFYNNIVDLKNNGKTYIPKYDFKSGKCELNKILIEKPDFLILEGIFSLYSLELRNISDIKIFVDTDEKTRFERRLKRDIKERGYTREHIENSFYKFSSPSYNQFIDPLKNICDYVILDDNYFPVIKKILL